MFQKFAYQSFHKWFYWKYANCFMLFVLPSNEDFKIDDE